MIFLKKYTEIWYFLQTIWKDGICKRGRTSKWSFLYYLKKWYFFFQKHDIFPWAESGGAAYLRKYMEIWHFLCTCTGVTNVVPRPSVKKKSRMVLSRKTTLKCDWRFRLTSYKEFQQFFVFSWRPLQAFSCIAL